MQASKIKVGGVYAANFNNKLARFHVTRVTTHRTQDTGSPHDYTSEVAGRFDEDPRPFDEKLVVLAPEKVLGPYTEHKELVERKAREEAEAKRVRDEREAYEEHVCDEIAALLAVPRKYQPGNSRYERTNVEFSYRGLSFSDEATKQLIDYLKIKSQEDWAEGREAA